MNDKKPEEKNCPLDKEAWIDYILKTFDKIHIEQKLQAYRFYMFLLLYSCVLLIINIDFLELKTPSIGITVASFGIIFICKLLYDSQSLDKKWIKLDKLSDKVFFCNIEKSNEIRTEYLKIGLRL